LTICLGCGKMMLELCAGNRKGYIIKSGWQVSQDVNGQEWSFIKMATIKNSPNSTAQAKETITALRPRKTPPAQKPSSKPDYGATHQYIQPASREDKTLTCRYELKYRIPETKARMVAQYIQTYIRPDKYSEKCPDFAYPLASLYFDSDTLHLCRETIEGKKNRFKLRIRCYEDNPQSPCFFEIKRRINNVIFKDRARLTKNIIAKLVQGGRAPDSLDKRDHEVLSLFQFYLQSLRANPVVLVRYMRQAFEGEDPNNRVRITFDRGLSFKTTNQPVVTLNGSGWYHVPTDCVVLEIKFSSRYPLWLSDMARIFDLQQSAFSKYVSSVKQSCAMGFCNPMALL